MTTNYPGSLDSYSTKVDAVDDVEASHINDLQDAVVAIETELGANGVNYVASEDNPLSNIFINGGCDIWQRTTDDTGVTTTRKYVMDRWAVTTGAGTLAHVQRSTTVRSGGLTRYSMQLDGAAGVGTVDIDQRIEAAMSGLYKQEMAFSCYVYNGSGSAFNPSLHVSTPSAADNWTVSTVRNGGGSGESLQECADGSWTQVTWTADISGYTNIDNGVEFRLRIPSGSLVASDVVRLTEMNLVQGDVITPIIGRALGQELLLCQRYYFYIPPALTGPIAFGYAQSGTVARCVIPSPATMRTTPTIAGGSNRVWCNGASPTVTSIDTINVSNGICANFNVAAGLTGNHATVVALTTSNMTFDAEL